MLAQTATQVASARMFSTAVKPLIPLWLDPGLVGVRILLLCFPIMDNASHIVVKIGANSFAIAYYWIDLDGIPQYEQSGHVFSNRNCRAPWQAANHVARAMRDGASYHDAIDSIPSDYRKTI